MAVKKKAALSQDRIWRVLDANANRAREGLRVVEDTARFIVSQEHAAEELRILRHRLDSILRHHYVRLLKYRDVEGDVGRTNASTPHREGIPAILASNFKRCEEALRVLEEYGRVVAPRAVRPIQAIRFGVYQWEKKLTDAIKAQRPVR